MELKTSTKIDIGIIENDFIIQETLELLLQEIGHNVVFIACNEKDAIFLLKEKSVKLVLLDIGLSKEYGGIDVARFVRENLKIPFIFITGNSDKTTLSKAKETNPDAYLLKPFRKEDIFIAIEVAMQNFIDRKENTAQEVLFVKDGTEKKKIVVDDILFIESSHVYVSVVLKDQKLLVREALTDFHSKLPQDQFVKVHRGYIINLKKISRTDTGHLYIGDYTIPISKNYRAAFKAAFYNVS